MYLVTEYLIRSLVQQNDRNRGIDFILSWCLQAYQIYADSGVYKQKNASKLLQMSHYGEHGKRPLAQQPP